MPERYRQLGGCVNIPRAAKITRAEEGVQRKRAFDKKKAFSYKVPKRIFTLQINMFTLQLNSDFCNLK